MVRVFSLLVSDLRPAALLEGDGVGEGLPALDRLERRIGDAAAASAAVGMPYCSTNLDATLGGRGGESKIWTSPATDARVLNDLLGVAFTLPEVDVFRSRCSAAMLPCRSPVEKGSVCMPDG